MHTGFQYFLFTKTNRYKIRDSRNIQGFALIYEQSCSNLKLLFFQNPEYEYEMELRDKDSQGSLFIRMHQVRENFTTLSTLHYLEVGDNTRKNVTSSVDFPEVSTFFWILY